jgi:phage terminase small subunit
MARQKTEKQIRESLLLQLTTKGANVAHFEGLVEDYLTLFRLSKQLKADIKKRGLCYTAVSATGREYEKDNPSVKLLPQYTKAMLTILRELGLTTDEPVAEEDDQL